MMHPRHRCALLLVPLLLLNSTRGLPAPLLAQEATVPSIEALRAKAQDRMRQDRARLSNQDFREIETTYQSANKDLRAPSARDALRQLVQKYPTSNRAGCAVLYLAQMSSGSEREEYLTSAIANHGDAWYGDGVQVGAYARAQLASFYANSNRLSEALKLTDEVKTQFPGAVDHSGVPLADTLRKMKLLQ